VGKRHLTEQWTGSWRTIPRKEGFSASCVCSCVFGCRSPLVSCEQRVRRFLHEGSFSVLRADRSRRVQNEILPSLGLSMHSQTSAERGVKLSELIQIDLLQLDFSAHLAGQGLSVGQNQLRQGVPQSWHMNSSSFSVVRRIVSTSSCDRRLSPYRFDELIFPTST